jgi:autotransporter-associated beta strand protein
MSEPTIPGAGRAVLRSLLLFGLLHFALATHAQLPSGTWQYSWGDDFSGKTLDQTKWSYNYPWGTTHNHNATMNADNAVQGDGTLTLVAERTGTGATFRSGAISSGYTKTTINGGYIEARILLPNTPGSWPAFWGLYTGWPPEMDIMEYPIDTAAGSGYAQDQYHTAFHYLNTSGNNAAGAGQVNPGSAGDLGGSYHTFGVNWVDDTSVAFYFDGAQVSSFVNSEVSEMVYMYLIFNYAVGGWPGTPSTTEWPVGHIDETKIDWVRVWKQAAALASDWAYTGASEDVQWDTAANWSNGVPNLGGVTSSFNTVTPAQQRLDWSGRRTLSVINLNGSTRYRFGWPDDRLVLGYGNNGSLVPTINLAATTTTEHEILGELEWAGALNINNDSSHALLLTGKTMGGDGINVNGTGIVSFDGNNTYSGTTVIDSGSQGPGIARARGQNALGLGGLVVIGEAGNDTTARLELENNSLVSNNINLNGRNNASVGIRNNSGSNTISGTINAQVGGSIYLIESDAGKLMLTGGVALRNGAGGTRTFTLQGAGEGVVGGVIENGSGVVNLAKTGAGSWTFEGQNTYTGTTTVSQGTLVVNGTTGTGGTTVGSGATLGGRGTVRSNLVAQTGATVRVGGNGIPSLSNQAHELIENFASYPPGAISSTANSQNTTGRKWVGVHDGTANAVIVNNSGNQALAVNGINAASGWRGAITDLQNNFNQDFSLPHGATGTYFFRVRRTGTATIDAIFGLTDQAAKFYTPPGNDTADPWNEYAVMLSIFGDSSTGMLRAYDEGDGDVNIVPAGANQWINVWVTVNNAAKTFRVATSTGSNNGTDSGRAYDFGRRTAAMVGANPLVTFGVHEFRNVSAEIDDLHYVAGTNLTNPLAVTPVLTDETLTVENDFALAAGATLEMDLFSTNTYDQLVVGGNLNANGTLRVLLSSGAPAPALGDAFTLFPAGGLNGSFASNSLPALNPGLGWNFNPTNGVLSVVQTVATNPVSIDFTLSSGTLLLSWPEGHTGWRLGTQTNALATGLGNNWFEVAGSSSTNQMSFTAGPDDPSVFFRLVYP